MFLRWYDFEYESQQREIRLILTAFEKALYSQMDDDTIASRWKSWVFNLCNTYHVVDEKYKRRTVDKLFNNTIKRIGFSYTHKPEIEVILEEDEIMSCVNWTMLDSSKFKEVPERSFIVDDTGRPQLVSFPMSENMLKYDSNYNSFLSNIAINIYFLANVGESFARILKQYEKENVYRIEEDEIHIKNIVGMIINLRNVFNSSIDHTVHNWLLPVDQNTRAVKLKEEVFFSKGQCSNEWIKNCRIFEMMEIRKQYGTEQSHEEQMTEIKEWNQNCLMIEETFKKRLGMPLQELYHRVFYFDLICQAMNISIVNSVCCYDDREKKYKSIRNRIGIEMVLLNLFGITSKENISGDITIWQEKYEVLLADIIGKDIKKHKIDMERVMVRSYYNDDYSRDLSIKLCGNQQCRIGWKSYIGSNHKENSYSRENDYCRIKNLALNKAMKIMSKQFKKSCDRCEKMAWMLANDMGSNPGHSRCLQDLHELTDHILIRDIPGLANIMIGLQNDYCCVEIESKICICENALATLVIGSCCDEDIINNINILIEVIYSMTGIYDNITNMLRESHVHIEQYPNRHSRNNIEKANILGVYCDEFESGEVKHRAKLFIDEIGWNMSNRSNATCLFTDLVLCDLIPDDENLIRFKSIGRKWLQSLKITGEQIVDGYLKSTTIIYNMFNEQVILKVNEHAGGTNLNMKLNYYNAIRIIFCAMVYYFSSEIKEIDSEDDLPSRAIIL